MNTVSLRSTRRWQSIDRKRSEALVLARHIGGRVVVADLGVASALKPHPDLKIKKVAWGTQNMTRGPAMSREEAIHSIEAGMELVEAESPRGLDILGTGDMGIGNTTPSSAITAAITGADVVRVTGRGTGLDDDGWERPCRRTSRRVPR